MNLPEHKKIILFDGVCNLCNRMVQFVIKHDKKDLFRFVALQSELGQEIQRHIGIDTKNIDSVILYDPGHAYYYKSSAAIEIMQEFGGVFYAARLFKIIPNALRNGIYDYVARNRYSWYGKTEHCMMPTPEIKAKFL
ncbi:MAG: thiol-disulfide oxidoreductase [Flavobacterium sp. BFFFF1]|uniref:thiol-disulfide oxidoreductase DCC family protein n=1 Tax=Flavobacterium sp. BFFFF1 TaxID=2015557 RepID=UPI000BD319D7|nr:thiol-disulfide oxidoreductase DCC family protein [Flavobacterium sp. BFFFF1]OYU81233.1 MAG: thiol-disulfide oxidoreductase [Flavobacterium sp. BFFFF1]